jgi:hypothetical protein
MLLALLVPLLVGLQQAQTTTNSITMTMVTAQTVRTRATTRTTTQAPTTTIVTTQAPTTTTLATTTTTIELTTTPYCKDWGEYTSTRLLNTRCILLIDL